MHEGLDNAPRLWNDNTTVTGKLEENFGISPLLSSTALFGLGHGAKGLGEGLMNTARRLPETLSVARTNLMNRGTGARQLYPWQRMPVGEMLNLKPMTFDFEGNNLRALPRGKEIPLIEDTRTKPLLLDYGPFYYDEAGNYVGNPRYYYRMGIGLIDDALKDGTVNVKSSIGEQPKVGLFNFRKEFSVPFWKSGGLWYKHGVYPDLITSNRTNGVDWKALTQHGGFKETKNQRSARTTPLIDGEPNMFPTKDTRLYRFNVNTNKYEPYSEIDWEHWLDDSINNEENRQILKSHLEEYYNIERDAKVDGNWLKMADGSIWSGHPGSWVQLQSINGQKLMPLNGFYSGVPSWNIPTFPSFNGDVYMANNPQVYNHFSGLDGSKSHVEGVGTNYPVTIPKTYKIAQINAGGAHYSSIPLPHSNEHIEMAIPLLQREGYQGMMLKNVVEGAISPNGITDDFVIFNGTPRKSLIGNNGDFNLTDYPFHPFKKNGGKLK